MQFHIEFQRSVFYIHMYIGYISTYDVLHKMGELVITNAVELLATEYGSDFLDYVVVYSSQIVITNPKDFAQSVYGTVQVIIWLFVWSCTSM